MQSESVVQQQLHTTELVRFILVLFLFRLPNAYYFWGAHTASTERRLSTLGHGSFTKLLFDTVTEHLCFPMHFCKIGGDGIACVNMEIGFLYLKFFPSDILQYLL